MEAKTGHALVFVTSPSDHTLIFNEKGAWDAGPEPSSSFTNSFQWTLHPQDGLLSLEHLRYGKSQPVHLFDLTLVGPGSLESVLAHQCAKDTYMGRLQKKGKGLELSIRVIGPNKNSRLDYYYERIM